MSTSWSERVADPPEERVSDRSGAARPRSVRQQRLEVREALEQLRQPAQPVPDGPVREPAAAFSTSGRYWFNPSEVDWVHWWQVANFRPATDWGRTDAAVSFQLPGGGSCTLEFQFDGSGPGHGLGPARDAKDYVQATADDGTLLRDARIPVVIRESRGEHNTAPNACNAWGVQVPYGYGTHSYNPDAEYLQAVLAGTRTAIYRHLAATGSAPNGIGYSFQNRCIGEQQ